MPQLETRKIVALGGSLVVPLPKGWLRYHHLEKGDEVELVANRNIIIRSIRKEHKDRGTVLSHNVEHEERLPDRR